MIRNIFIYVVLFCGVLFARLMTADTLMHYYAFRLVLYMMLLYPVVQLCYVNLVRCAISARLQIDKEVAYKNHTVTYQLQIQNNSILPIAYGSVWIEWRNMLSGKKETEKIPFSMLPKDSMNIGGVHTCNSCGCIGVYVKRIEVYDMVRMWRVWHGFYPFRKRFADKRNHLQKASNPKKSRKIDWQLVSELVVMPSANNEFHTQSEEFVQDVSETENTKWMKPDDSAREMIEIREYRAGDKMQKIHWKASAKMDSMMVRQMGETMNEQACVFFDHYIPYRKKTDYMDKMLEIFVTRCKAMTEAGQEFRIAWCDNGKIVLHHIKNQSQLWKTMKLMMKQRYAKEAKAITMLAREHSIKDMNLYYIATGWSNQDENAFVKLLDKTKLVIYLVDDYEKREVSEHVVKLMERTKHVCVWRLSDIKRIGNDM